MSHIRYYLLVGTFIYLQILFSSFLGLVAQTQQGFMIQTQAQLGEESKLKMSVK